MPYSPEANLSQLNDAAIAYAFTNYWLPYANSTFATNPVNGKPLDPWFCAVSFINPHDISDFPYPYGLTANNNTTFVPPTKNASNGYQPPPLSGSPATYYGGNNCVGGNNNCTADGDFITIPAFTNSGPYSALPAGLGNNSGKWNWEALSSMPYASNAKPGLQLYFLEERNAICGTVTNPGTYSSNNWSTPTAWRTFLNYYIWMQSCVDYQVGQVLTALQGNSDFWNNTVIIFTSDHGDYGGSHGIHSKGGALYEEVMNVPLYISFPALRQNPPATPPVLPFVCSAVDLLPFLYTLALGNTGSYDWQQYQSYILHTADDYFLPQFGSNYAPGHAIAYRTADQTDVNNNSAPFYPQVSSGGGKLGIYPTFPF